mmetsp:Transcript_4440/g.9887  ORF Transcript_4440/g.9887 Transcript_4440/m.9887 type:complete len:213 (-) Transcript_4440:738-1376(-)
MRHSSTWGQCARPWVRTSSAALRLPSPTSTSAYSRQCRALVGKTCSSRWYTSTARCFMPGRCTSPRRSFHASVSYLFRRIRSCASLARGEYCATDASGAAWGAAGGSVCEASFSTLTADTGASWTAPASSNVALSSCLIGAGDTFLIAAASSGAGFSSCLTAAGDIFLTTAASSDAGSSSCFTTADVAAGVLIAASPAPTDSTMTALLCAGT